MDEKEKQKETALILFSGGYDSVAVLHKMIMSDDFEKIWVLFEKNYNMTSDFELSLAKKAFNILNRTAQKHGVELVWREEQSSVDWINYQDHYDTFNRDLCLFVHLTTIMRHSAFKNIYLGWHKSNVKTLSISKQLLKWFEDNKEENYNINFIETYFDGNEHWSKYKVIKYLLDNNIFKYAYTSSTNENKNEYEKRTHWFLNNSKEREVARALLEFDEFSSEDLSKIFSFKTTQEIQELYNQKKKEYKKLEKENNHAHK